ncbi:MAG TPA: DUF1700 domain-containing protein [Lachnospiraceae bacterium]|nr:DUF1700 domain-containing protein [Lachnospiraceae bacterium]
MNRVEFMKQLEALLFDISSSEKEEAIQYYSDYFDDAGVENEAYVINELGSPEKVAATIKESHEIKDEKNDNSSYNNNNSNNKNTALLIIIGVLTFPFWFPLFIGLAGTAFGIVMALLGIVLGIGLAGIALMISSVILLGFSIVKLLFSPLGGLCLIGISLFMCGIAILMCMLAWAIAFQLIPVLARGVFKLCQMPFKNRGGCVA